MTAAVVRGDARRLPLPDASVDLICTSPPYFGLRSYTDAGEHYAGQIGSEATPAEWLAALVECTREWMRVLKPEGSIFVNLGDKYAGGHGGSSTEGNGVTIRKRSSFAANPRERPDLPDPPASWSTRDVTGRNVVPGFAPKSLMGLPWRYALACTDQLGLILRAEIIWAKPNGLPESVTDRVRRSHEQVFHLVRQPRYYAAVDEIREPTSEIGRKPKAIKAGPLIGNHGTAGHDGNGMRMAEVYNNPLGKLPGSVWDIPSSPLVTPAYMLTAPLGWLMTDHDAWAWVRRTGVTCSRWPRDDSRRELRAAPAHFAAFPPSLVRPVVLGWSPPGVCMGCGQGRRPVTSEPAYIRLSRPHNQHNSPTCKTERNTGNNRSDASLPYGTSATKLSTITGYVCACPTPDAPTRPALVVDPFGGTGTTALVASVYGRIGITVDLSADYTRLARWRTRDPGERARAMQVPKPPPVPDGQDALFAI